MPDISAALHQRIVQTLDASRQDVRNLARAPGQLQGYVGFDLVENNLVECKVAVENLRDRETVLTMLRRLAGVTRLTGGGAVAPAVDRLHQQLADLEDALQRS
jgi:hypothetical protein